MTGAVNKQPKIIGRFYKSIKKSLKKCSIQNSQMTQHKEEGTGGCPPGAVEDDKGFCLISLTVSDTNSSSRGDRWGPQTCGDGCWKVQTFSGDHNHDHNLPHQHCVPTQPLHNQTTWINRIWSWRAMAQTIAERPVVDGGQLWRASRCAGQYERNVWRSIDKLLSKLC